MPQVIQTRAECDVCGVVEERGYGDGAPPVGWAYVRVSRRLDGAGWTQREIPFDGILCPKCQAMVLAALGVTETDAAAEAQTGEDR